MLIVSDTTPIITLTKMGHLDILKQLYGKVLIPNAVYMELTSNKKFVTEASQVGVLTNLWYLHRYFVVVQLSMRRRSNTTERYYYGYKY